MTQFNQHRHAFLIMAHNEFNVLRTLVELLDHERNDIFIHYDKKIDHLPDIKCLHSNLFVLDHRIDNRWGTVTQIETEYLIFEEAVMHGPYMYYHLLSGVDLPIKSMHEIHEFFDAVKGKKEFVEVAENSQKYEFRIQQYHFCVDKIRSKNKIVVWSAKIFGKISPWIQKCIGIVRNKDLKICYGSNWVSITDDLVRYLIDYKCDVINRCQYSKCADEIFLQTILWNSPFRNNLLLYSGW